MEELKIVLSLDEINLIISALSELSFKIASPLIQKIILQGESQIKAKQQLITMPSSVPQPQSPIPIDEEKAV
jgi:hypothetical protein